MRGSNVCLVLGWLGERKTGCVGLVVRTHTLKDDGPILTATPMMPNYSPTVMRTQTGLVLRNLHVLNLFGLEPKIDIALKK